MGFLDDLDQAFDQLLSPNENEGQAIESDDEQLGGQAIEDDGSNSFEKDAELLKTAIANAQSVGIHALFRLVQEIPRKPFLAALQGSFQYLAIIEPSVNRRQVTQTMLLLLTTKQGQTRKRLTQNQMDTLLSAKDTYTASRDEDVAQAKGLLGALARQKVVHAEVFQALYKAGIWQLQQFRAGSSDQLAALSGLSTQQIDSLKVALHMG